MEKKTQELTLTLDMYILSRLTIYEIPMMSTLTGTICILLFFIYVQKPTIQYFPFI